MNTILALWAPSVAELCIIAAIALLLFGKRLPSVARNMGSAVVELRKGFSEAIDGEED
jgi:TatA/E family protein of Tat protein translocase